MAASYPNSIVSLANHSDGDTVFAADVNTPNAEIVAVETGLLNGVQHNLKPLADAGKDLGDSTHAWNNIWSKGTVQLNGVAYTFPAADGTANQGLTTNGSKVLSWSTPNSLIYTAKSALYTAVAYDLVAITSGTFTVTLPAASANSSKPIAVVNNGTGTITIGRTGADTIGLATSQTLNPATASAQGDSMTFISDGVSNWNIF